MLLTSDRVTALENLQRRKRAELCRELLELGTASLEPRLHRPRKPSSELVAALGLLPEPVARAYDARGDMLEELPLVREIAKHAALEPRSGVADLGGGVDPVAAYDLGRRGWRRSAQIGDKVGDREINLVAYG